jgi:hypothetical protein
LGLRGREGVTGDWRKLHNEELHIGTAHQMLLVRTNQEDVLGRECGMYGVEDKCMQRFGGET